MTQGLLGRHPDIMGSCGPCWLLNFRYLGVGRCQGRCRGLWGPGPRGRVWAWGASLHPHPTHASRQVEDFTRARPSALRKHST